MGDGRNLLLATTNAGKVGDLTAMLAELPIRIVSLSSLPAFDEVEETGSTFAENARLKAVGYARQSGMWTIADDSGLEVTALGGRPGVLSARYGGETTKFNEKMDLLLAELAVSDSLDRTARFVCSIAVADGKGEICIETDGICNGSIAFKQEGKNGFGYDPIFVPQGHDLTFAQMTVDEKRHLSHRGRAFSQIMPFLCGFCGIST